MNVFCIITLYFMLWLLVSREMKQIYSMIFYYKSYEVSQHAVQLFNFEILLSGLALWYST